jgi:hypothetical protein
MNVIHGCPALRKFVHARNLGLCDQQQLKALAAAALAEQRPQAQSRAGSSDRRGVVVDFAAAARARIARSWENAPPDYY